MSCATEKDPPTTTEKDGNPPTPPEPPAEGVVLAVGTACIPIDQIQIGERHRKVVGDIESLKQSIEKLGLLHFIIVTVQGLLVAGFRRLEACKSLGMQEVPVHVVDCLDDALLR